MDSLPNFLTHAAPLARFARENSAKNGHRHGDHVMVGDVDHCFRFFQNWHTPERWNIGFSGLILFAKMTQASSRQRCFELAIPALASPCSYEVKEQV